MFPKNKLSSFKNFSFRAKRNFGSSAWNWQIWRFYYFKIGHYRLRSCHQNWAYKALILFYMNVMNKLKFQYIWTGTGNHYLLTLGQVMKCNEPKIPVRLRADRSGSYNFFLHKWVKLLLEGHFQAHKLFPEMMHELNLFTGYFTFILNKFGH